MGHAVHKTGLHAVLGIVVMLVVGPLHAHAAHGPMSVRNSHPLFHAIGSHSLISAVPSDSVTLRVNYSSTYMVKQSGEWDIAIDLETTLVELTVTRKMTARSEVRLNIPVIAFQSGFLDGILEEYHDAFGFPDYGRHERPKNDFLFSVRHNGRTVIQGVPGEFSLGDIRIGVTQVLVSGESVVSMYGYVELPTGDPDRGYGNGAWDGGIMILADIRFGDGAVLYFNGGYVFVDRYRAAEDIPLRGYPFIATGFEWLYSQKVSLYGQCALHDSPYEFGIGVTDRTSSILSLGGAYAISRQTGLEVSFSEDINTAGAPDFMVEAAFFVRY